MSKTISISFAIWKATADGFVSFSLFRFFFFLWICPWRRATHTRLRKITSGKIHVRRPTPIVDSENFSYRIRYVSPALWPRTHMLEGNIYVKMLALYLARLSSSIPFSSFGIVSSFIERTVSRSSILLFWMLECENGIKMKLRDRARTADCGLRSIIVREMTCSALATLLRAAM